MTYRLDMQIKRDSSLERQGYFLDKAERAISYAWLFGSVTLSLALIGVGAVYIGFFWHFEFALSVATALAPLVAIGGIACAASISSAHSNNNLAVSAGKAAGKAQNELSEIGEDEA